MSTDWLNKVGGLTWDGNQTVNDGEGIYVLASQNGSSTATRAGDFTTDFKAAIDGFDIRGGNQNGFPGNINDLTGGPTGLPPNITTQGGAIFANSYARTCRSRTTRSRTTAAGTGPSGSAPRTSRRPDTNTAQRERRGSPTTGSSTTAAPTWPVASDIFAGADSYEVADNDICGNFSFEYGGGLTRLRPQP